jgi:hypothetical protein
LILLVEKFWYDKSLFLLRAPREPHESVQKNIKPTQDILSDEG